MSGSSAIAAKPSIERLDLVVAPSLGRFFFGLRDRIADATLFEFGNAHRDLEIDLCRDPLPVSHRMHLRACARASPGRHQVLAATFQSSASLALPPQRWA